MEKTKFLVVEARRQHVVKSKEYSVELILKEAEQKEI